MTKYNVCDIKVSVIKVSATLKSLYNSYDVIAENLTTSLGQTFNSSRSGQLNLRSQMN